MKILFVCLGNICRSPMAEAIFRSLSAQKGFIVEVDSAGTSSLHKGERPHVQTISVLENMGIIDNKLVSRPLKNHDFEYFDIIIGMDNQNIVKIKKIAPKNANIKLFLDIISEYQGLDVPDPWYTGDFEETRRLITRGCEAWLHELSNQ